MRRVHRLIRIIGVLSALAAPGAAFAQSASQASPAAGKLTVTVADPSGGMIPSAKVVVIPQDQAGKSGATPESTAALTLMTSPTGAVTIEGLTPGRYTVIAEFPGFETVTMKDVRVRAGDNRRNLVLPLKRVSEDVVVGRDTQTAGLDPRGNAFSTVLTREQIAALPDDPDEMEAALKAMAPPGAVMRVDGFSGGKLPPKSQIQSIRLPRMDQLAAQNHGGGMNGMMHIDIMTQPGNGPMSGSLDFAFRDESLNAQNPFTPFKGQEGLQQGGLTFGGSLVPNKSSFSVSVQYGSAFDSGNILAAVPNGETVASPIRRPVDRASINARFNQGWGDGHLLRFSYQRTANEMRNQGVGSYDLIGRAYASTFEENVFRMSENGAIGRRGFGESRLQVRWSDSTAASAVEAPTVRVLDAFTSGSAQRRGGSRVVDFEAASDLDYVRGTHSMRMGLLFEGGRYRSNDEVNYFGTYTFASLDDFNTGRASNYTRRTGDPALEYSNFQAGAYWQDDYRVRKSMLLSYGVRYEGQTLIGDWNNISPRATLTWSPFKSGRTNFRAGTGWFSDWMAASTYEQTLRVDGLRQREMNIINPSFPDPGAGGVLLPSNRYQFVPGLTLPATFMANAGVDHTFTPSLRMNASYSYRRGDTLLRGRNINGPVDGVRPDPRFSNVIEVVGDAGARIHTVNVGMSYLKLNWKQTMVAGNYTWMSNETNTTGAFSLPANGDDLSSEWGPAAPQHRVGITFNMQPIPGWAVSAQLRAQSGMPYTVTAGQDLNQDGVFNDRPTGVGRNTELTDAQWDLGLRVSYVIGFGERAATGAGGGATVVMIGGSGGGMPGGFGGGAANKRYRIEFYVAAQNVTNHDNYIGYSGVVTSPFFGQPTNVLNPRKIELGARFGF